MLNYFIWTYEDIERIFFITNDNAYMHWIYIFQKKVESTNLKIWLLYMTYIICALVCFHCSFSVEKNTHKILIRPFVRTTNQAVDLLYEIEPVWQNCVCGKVLYIKAR